MMSRGFDEGQPVRLQSGSVAGSRDVLKQNASEVPPTRIYEVVQRLTNPAGEPLYRIRRLEDFFERTVRESQLKPAVRDQQQFGEGILGGPGGHEVTGHSVHIKIDGRTYSGTYTIDRKVLTVKTSYGRRTAGIPPKVGHEALAHQLLTELQLSQHNVQGMLW